MRKLTEIEQKLIDKLKEIRPSREFILGVCAALKTDEERSFVLECINNKTVTEPPEISLLAINVKKIGLD